ncbi:MAG: hypothetical protein ACFC03_03005 [Candidatus Malihini olakiniferum]
MAYSINPKEVILINLPAMPESRDQSAHFAGRHPNAVNLKAVLTREHAKIDIQQLHI